MNDETAAHRSFHRSRLKRLGPYTDRRLDAIVVSAARSAINLTPAMELATELRTRLMVLCSGGTDAEEAWHLGRAFPDADLCFIDVSSYRPPAYFQFETDGLRKRVGRLGDLSRKRNLALVLAHLCGWRTIMMLDDDIRDLSPRTVLRATRRIRPGGVVGMIANDFPDNSVVCHARRAARLSQGVFISGSALVVDTTEVDSFFPELYNEDWLFMHDRVRDGRASSTGTVRQLSYDPFRDPSRAAAEELGDVLAEGLVSLQHASGDLELNSDPAWWKHALDSLWWQSVLDQRGAMLEDLIDRLPVGGTAAAAVAAARDAHHDLVAEDLVNYVDRWRKDVDALPDRLLTVPRDLVFPDALTQLGLEAAVGPAQADVVSIGGAGGSSSRFHPRSLTPAAFYSPHSDGVDQELLEVSPVV